MFIHFFLPPDHATAMPMLPEPSGLTLKTFKLNSKIACLCKLEWHGRKMKFLGYALQSIFSATQSSTSSPFPLKKNTRSEVSKTHREQGARSFGNCYLIVDDWFFMSEDEVVECMALLKPYHLYCRTLL